MGRVAVIGAGARVAGYALAGATVIPAESAAAARQAWDALPPDVAVVILTPEASRALPPERPVNATPLVVVMPS